MLAFIKRIIGVTIHDAEKLIRHSLPALRYSVRALLYWTGITLSIFLTGLAIPFLAIAAICGIVGSVLIELGDELGLPSRSKEKVEFDVL
jgi:hypothetical protein